MTDIPLIYLDFPIWKHGKAVKENPDNYIEDVKEFVKELVEFAKSEGITEVYIFGADEEAGKALKARRKEWEAIHQTGVRVTAAVFKGYFELVGDLLDLVIVAGSYPWNKDEMHKLGHKVYCYGNPQVGVEKPLTYRRNFGLYLWKAGFDGACNFAYQFDMGGNIWDDFDKAAGTYRDHVFAYPTINGVVDTIQWEGWREGVDDVRYLTTLLKILEEAKKKNYKLTLIKETEKWLKNINLRDDLQKIRYEMAQRIINLTIKKEK